MGNVERWGLVPQDGPDSGGPGRYPVYVPTPNRGVDVLILSDTVLGLMMHWTGQETYPCMSLGGLCDGCQRYQPLKWQGYVAGYDVHAGRSVIVPITAEAMRGCSALTDLAGDLRGWRLQLRRMGTLKTSRVGARLSLPGKPWKDLPACFDLLDALGRVWGLPEEGRGSSVVQEENDRDPLTEGL